MVELQANYLESIKKQFQYYKLLGDRSLERVEEAQMYWQFNEESNSMAVIVQHLIGNMMSRWTDFLTSDGEKPDRHRDTEFELIDDSRETLMTFWESGWQILFANIEPLTVEDFSKTVTIRGESHSICEAMNRQMTHYAYHVGQIVLLAKHFRSADWRTLSVPKNRSSEFNQFLAEKQASGVSKSNRMEAALEFAGDKEPK